MTQMMDLNKMGLAPLSNFEMKDVDGGWNWNAVTAFAGVVVGQIAIVGGVLTLQPEIFAAGAAITSVSLDILQRNS